MMPDKRKQLSDGSQDIGKDQGQHPSQSGASILDHRTVARFYQDPIPGNGQEQQSAPHYVCLGKPPHMPNKIAEVMGWCALIASERTKN